MTIPTDPIAVAIQSIQIGANLYPFRIENPFGITTDVDVVDDAQMRIFYSTSDDWLKVQIKAGAEGKLFTPGSMWGDNNTVYSGSNLATTATEYFVGTATTTIPTVIFPTNGESILSIGVNCVPTTGSACNHVVNIVSHGDGNARYE